MTWQQKGQENIKNFKKGYNMALDDVLNLLDGYVLGTMRQLMKNDIQELRKK